MLLRRATKVRKMSRKAKRRPKNASRVQKMSSWETPEAESKFEIWEDAEWEPALRALEGYGTDSEFSGKPDPKALAKLLRSGKPVPEAVAKQLGWWLDPPWRNKGPSLTVYLPKRYYPTAKGLKERIIVKSEVWVHFGDLPKETEIVCGLDAAVSWPFQPGWKAFPRLLRCLQVTFHYEDALSCGAH